MKAFISQPNYLPWKGYFDAIQQADVYISLDTVQYTRRDWRNRNRIKTANGLQWLTIPVKVKGKFEQPINETRVSASDWAARHWNTIRQHYRAAPCFDQCAEEIEKLFSAPQSDLLAEINLHFTSGLCDLFHIDTPIHSASSFDAPNDPNDRLIELCRHVGADVYLSGPSARAYLDEKRFLAAGISVEWLNYARYPEYPQLFGTFVHEVSVVDLLLNTGSDAAKYLAHTRANAH